MLRRRRGIGTTTRRVGSTRSSFPPGVTASLSLGRAIRASTRTSSVTTPTALISARRGRRREPPPGLRSPTTESSEKVGPPLTVRGRGPVQTSGDGMVVQ